jgi:hypothetical protein
MSDVVRQQVTKMVFLFMQKWKANHACTAESLHATLAKTGSSSGLIHSRSGLRIFWSLV